MSDVQSRPRMERRPFSRSLASLAVLLLWALPATAQFARRQVLYQGAGGEAELNDRFGAVLTTLDFDCDGFTDLAVGTPLEDDNVGVNDAGEVRVYWGSAAGLERFYPAVIFDGAPEAGDGLGGALAAGDFDGDACDDLAIGIPYRDDGAPDAGLVWVFYGDPIVRSLGVAGLVKQPWHQDIPGVIGFRETDNNFGAALTAGDFNGDQIDDLAIGVPGEDLNQGYGEGYVHALRGSPTGLEAVDNSSWNQGLSQDLSSMDDTGEPGDLFGYALAAGDFDANGVDDLAIGVPGENGLTGAVHIVFGTTSLEPDGHNVFCPVDEGPSWVGSHVTVGRGLSLDGATLPVLGVPLFDSVGAADTGIVGVITSDCEGLTIDQGDVPGGLQEAGELFGQGTVVADLDGDGFGDLVVGTPGEAVSIPAGRQGVLHVFFGPLDNTRPVATYHQGSFGPGELSEQGDEFGSVLAAGDFDGDGRMDIAVGVPSEDVGTVDGNVANAGAVQILYTFNPIFADGFESGDTSAWASTVGN